MPNFGSPFPAGLQGYMATRQLNEQSSANNLRGAMGSMGMLAQIQKMQQEQQFRGEIAAAKTPEEQAAIAARFGGPDAIMRTMQGSLDRKATLDAAKLRADSDREQRLHEITLRGQEAIDRVREAAAQNRITREEADRREATMRENLVRLTANLRPPPPPRPIQLTKDAEGNQLIVNPDGTTRPLTTQGGGKPVGTSTAEGLSGEAAGKVAMADQAIMDLRGARSILFDKDGKMNRSVVAAMNIPLTAGMPGNADARSAYSRMQNAVSAKLRIETGAAATESEVRGILDRFLPKISDPESVAKERLDRLEEFMNITIDLTKGVRPGALRSRQPQQRRATDNQPVMKFDAQGNPINP